MYQNLSLDSIRYILLNMEDAVCITDGRGTLQFVNPAAEKLLGITGSSENRKKIWEAIPFIETNDDLIQLLVDSVQSQPPQFHKLVSFENRDHRFFRLRVSVTYSEKSNGFFMILSDLTDLVKVRSAFTRYTSSQIADYVLNTPNGEEQGGQSRNVSILMSDLRGFSAISSSMRANDLVTMLNHYFEAMVSVIEKCGGTVIEFLGDGIFVVFGAPKRDSRHADHAVECAIGMQNAMKDDNVWNRSHHLPILEMGIGINSGSTVVGNIGSDEKMKYGCIGHPVNVAGRIEAQTVGGQILISKQTKSLLKQEFRYSEERPFMPKGAGETITIYNTTGLGGLSLDEAGDEPITWLDIQKSPALFYRLLNEHKGVDEEEYPCRIHSLSYDGRYAYLLAEQPLSVGQNLMIEIGGDLYCKVMDRHDDGYILCFTSKPKNFSKWINELI